MTILEDEFNLRLLRLLVSGKGVKVNINSLSKRLDMHRTTIKNRVDALFSNQILDKPRYSYLHLFQEYPLLILALADIPQSPQARHFFEEDSHIFAAYTCREGPYNTLLLEFFKDMESYHSWREGLVVEQKLPSRENRATADVYFFSNKLNFKYNPTCFVDAFEEQIKSKGKFTLNSHVLDGKDYLILQQLMKGNSISPNEKYLANELGTNSKKIQRRISGLLEHKIIDNAKCHFPDLLAPPKFNLIVTLVELKSNKSQIKNEIIQNNYISRALESSIGRYNTLIFSAFPRIDDFFEWTETLAGKYPDSIGAMFNIILSSKARHTINPQKVSIGLIEKKLRESKLGIVHSET